MFEHFCENNGRICENNGPRLEASVLHTPSRWIRNAQMEMYGELFDWHLKVNVLSSLEPGSGDREKVETERGGGERECCVAPLWNFVFFVFCTVRLPIRLHCPDLTHKHGVLFFLCT